MMDDENIKVLHKALHEILTLRNLLRESVEDGERLATTDSWRDGDSAINGEWCKFCDNEVIGGQDGDVYKCNHTPDCPITLHNELKKKVSLVLSNDMPKNTIIMTSDISDPNKTSILTNINQEGENDK